MNKNNLAVRNLILIFYLLTLAFCTSRNEPIDNTNNQPKEEIIDKIASEGSQRKNELNTNDSLSLLLGIKYPNAIKTDTLSTIYTFVFQNLLKKSSNVVFFQNGRIRDIEEYNGNYLITVDNMRDIQGRFLIKPSLWKEFVMHIGSKRGSRQRGGFIVNISSIIPIQSEIVVNIDDISNSAIGGKLSSFDISDYVNFSFDTRTRPFYILNGELIDFYLLN